MLKLNSKLRILDLGTKPLQCLHFFVKKFIIKIKFEKLL